MDFGQVLTKAWKIIWKFKVLWIFGILASCGQNGGGSSGGSGNTGVQYSSGDQNLPPGMRQFFDGFENFFDAIQVWQIAALIIGILFVVLIIAAISSAISTVGRIGLVQGTVKAEAGAERMTFGELFNSGKPFFWRIFGFNLLAGLAVMIIVILLMLPIIGLGILTFGIGMLCLIPIICLLIPASWLITIIFEQVNIAIVLEDLNIPDGLKRGWEVFRENIGNMIVMSLILVVGGAIVGIVIALPVILVMVPAAIGIIGGLSSNSDLLFGGGIATALVCLAAYLPVLIVLGGILQAYIKTAWTLTYIQLTQPSDLEIIPEVEPLDEVE